MSIQKRNNTVVVVIVTAALARSNRTKYNTIYSSSILGRHRENVSDTAERDAAGIHHERRRVATGWRIGRGRDPADRMVIQTTAFAQHHGWAERLYFTVSWKHLSIICITCMQILRYGRTSKYDNEYLCCHLCLKSTALKKIPDSRDIKFNSLTTIIIALTKKSSGRQCCHYRLFFNFDYSIILQFNQV